MARGSPRRNCGGSSGSSESRGPLATSRPTRLETARPGISRRLERVMWCAWWLRVGDWRVRFAHDDERRYLDVLRVSPRGKAYR